MIQFFRTLLKSAADADPSVREFRKALSREMLLTERLRVKTVIGTVVIVTLSLSIAYLLAPSSFARISNGQFDLKSSFMITGPLLLFEFFVLYKINQRIAAGQDIAQGRRYLSALIETSIPTAALHLHMGWMGPAAALAFAAPLSYFIFIILSTLRLDFWLSTFTGFVAAAQMLALAMLYHPVQFASEPAPDFAFQLIRSAMVLLCGILAGAVGLQAPSPVRGEHRGNFGARSCHQSVRSACLAAGCGAVAGVGNELYDRDASGRGDVRRYP